MNWKIPLFKMHYDEEDISSVEKVLRRGSFWADGPEIKEFENKIGKLLDMQNVLAFNSGTSALHTLLLAHDIEEKEIIVPSFTFIATSNAVLLAKGIPIFAESETETLGLDFEDVKRKISDKTKAIILVHFQGCPARDTIKLKKLAKEKNILLIEDAAQAFGAKIEEEHVGTLGDSSIFSLCQNKIITTGEGGIALTKSKKIYEKMKLIRSHGRFEEKHGDYFSNINENEYTTIGYNFRLPTINAALGISQLNKLDKIIKKRNDIASYLNQELSKINDIILPIAPKNHFNVYQMYTIILKNNEQRNNLQKFLEQKGIMTKVYFNPIHLSKLYQKELNLAKGHLPNTEDIANKVLTLPMHVELKNEELNYMVESINEFFKEKYIQK